jgi:hypothetical protein
MKYRINRSNKEGFQNKQVDIMKEINNNIKSQESNLTTEESRTFSVESVISDDELNKYKSFVSYSICINVYVYIV